MAMLPLEESQMKLIILLRNKALTMRKYLFPKIKCLIIFAKTEVMER